MSPLPLANYYHKRPLNFAHRGARHIAPENTLPAFNKAAELGSDGTELDIQLTKDNVPVVFHDKHVDRLTDGRGRLRDHTVAEVKNLDAGTHCSEEYSGTTIPTLAEVFETVGSRLLFNLELKSFTINQEAVNLLVASTIKIVSNYRYNERVIISSFNPLVLRAVKRLSPDLATGCLYAPNLPFPFNNEWVSGKLAGKNEARHPHYSIVDESYVKRAHHEGRRVNVWTVNETEDIEKMYNFGVDMIISDRPEIVNHVIHNAL